MIAVTELYKSFGRNPVLKGLNVSFKKSKITAVLGPNSSGKTTLMKAVLGMVIYDKGRITLDGEDIRSSCDYRNKIGYLPQIAKFPDNTTVAELFKMIQDLRHVDMDPGALIDYFDLRPFLNTRLGHLSGGTRQKVNIVQAFMFDPPYLLLDEPTSGLDPVSLIRLKELIRVEQQKGKTILITSHIMSFVEEMADEIIFILDGKIHFQGCPDLIKEQYMVPNLERAIANMLSGVQPLASSNGYHKKESAYPIEKGIREIKTINN